MLAQIVGIAASGAATSVRLTSRASNSTTSSVSGQDEPGERQRWAQSRHRHRAGRKPEREQRDDVGGHAQPASTPKRPVDRRLYRTRKRHRGQMPRRLGKTRWR